MVNSMLVHSRDDRRSFSLCLASSARLSALERWCNARVLCAVDLHGESDERPVGIHHIHRPDRDRR